MQYTGKSVEEAIEKGLKELNIKKDDAEINVLEEEVKGLFGKIKKDAVVDIREKVKVNTSISGISNDKEIHDDTGVVEFVQTLLKQMKFDVKVELKEGENTVINILADKTADIIGFKGECIDAIQTLANAKANIGRTEYKKIIVDCQNYRSRREGTLISLAHKLEAKATDMKREVILEPMSAFERRIIHHALNESNTVTTKSEGSEPNRYVVIVPNNKDAFSHPYNAGRNVDNRSFKKGKRFNKFGNGNRNGRNEHRANGFTGEKKKAPSGFGTYLGNSLKN